MPHAIIEYSRNIASEVQQGELCELAYTVMNDSGLFTPNAIKTRTLCADNWYVGEQGANGAFVHITIRLLEGRSEEQKSALTQAMFDTMKKALPELEHVSVDIADMTKATYRK